MLLVSCYKDSVGQVMSKIWKKKKKTEKRNTPNGNVTDLREPPAFNYCTLFLWASYMEAT